VGPNEVRFRRGVVRAVGRDEVRQAQVGQRSGVVTVTPEGLLQVTDSLPPQSAQLFGDALNAGCARRPREPGREAGWHRQVDLVVLLPVERREAVEVGQHLRPAETPQHFRNVGTKLRSRGQRLPGADIVAHAEQLSADLEAHGGVGYLVPRPI